MESFEPLINLLILMSALSIAAERLANAIKLRTPGLRVRKKTARREKLRERRIALRAVLASLALAVAVKADFFAILSHLEAPWETLGWARSDPATTSMGGLVQSISGMMVTGMSLGFGSKFWHDALDVMRGMRGGMRKEMEKGQERQMRKKTRVPVREESRARAWARPKNVP